MKMSKTFYASDLQSWRDWLEQNHQTEREVWLIFYKAHTGQPCVDYEDSVEEALCYGWIDSLIQRIDDNQYGRKFTPRTNTQKWSDTNKRRVEKLLREGRMTQAGLAKIEDLSTMHADPPAPRPKEVEVPAEIEAGLKANQLAWDNFCKLSPSHRRQYIGWISSGKREETRARRIQEAIGLLEQNRPLEGK